MENIPRDLAKEIAALQSLKPAKKIRRWTLLLVGDRGRVVTIGWFRWMVMAGAFLILLAVIVSVTLFFLYAHISDVNRRLQQSLNKVQQQIIGLRNDKDMLMAQLVLAESELEKSPAGTDRPRQVAKAMGARQEDGAKKQPRQAPQDVNPGVQGQAEGISPGAPLTAARAPETHPKVSIEEFNVFHEEDGDTYRAQFILKNAGPDSGPVSGYTAVILKKPNSQSDSWLTLPSVKLVDGIPAGGKRGQFFSISRFKTVKFMVKSKIDPRQFNAATVFVFDADETLLFEKSFSIHIQESVGTPNQ